MGGKEKKGEEVKKCDKMTIGGSGEIEKGVKRSDVHRAYEMFNRDGGGWCERAGANKII